MPKILNIRPIGRHQTYDLEVDHPDHQFYLANGLLTSNSHSDAYSVVTMQTAWLATYYPLQFYAAALTKAQANAVQTLVADIQKAGVKILPVDINKSCGENIIEGDSIRLSMEKVKGVGGSVVKKIMAARAEKPFENFLDFLDRSGAGKTAVAPLIKVGAFDSIFAPSDVCAGPNMRALEMFYEKICAEPKLKQKKNRKELEQLFWSMTSGSTLCDLIDDYDLEEKVGFENERMEFSLRGSPFEILDRDKKIDAIRASLTDVTTLDEFIESEDDVARIPVVLKDWKERPQRNGQMFAFMKFAVQTGEEFEAPAFSSVWKYVSKLAKKSSVYIATFNRKMDDPAALILGRPGWAQSEKSATQAMINVDTVEL